MSLQTLIAELYAAFNRRDVDGALALMSDEVTWPKASEGGRVAGKDDIRNYWSRQWQAFDPHVELLEVKQIEDGRVAVRVHQVVKNLAGELLAEGEVWHTYTLISCLVERMDLGKGEVDAAGEGPSAAFSHR